MVVAVSWCDLVALLLQLTNLLPLFRCLFHTFSLSLYLFPFSPLFLSLSPSSSPSFPLYFLFLFLSIPLSSLSLFFSFPRRVSPTSASSRLKNWSSSGRLRIRCSGPFRAT